MGKLLRITFAFTVFRSGPQLHFLFPDFKRMLARKKLSYNVEIIVETKVYELFNLPGISLKESARY